MKTRIILFLGLSAIVTLSFTFATSFTNTSVKSEPAVAKKNSSEPVGGFVSQDKL